jgi:N-acetylneuraminic acid mutarotase
VARRAGRGLALVVVAACGGDGGPAPDAGPWRSGPALPEPRLEAGVIALADELWVIGGFDEGLQVVADTWILEEGAAEWRRGPDAPAALTHPNLAVHGGRLFLLGGLAGQDFTPVGDGWVLESDTWTPVAAMPAGMERGAAAVFTDSTNVFLAGGASADAALASVLIYEPGTDTWSAGPDLPSPRSHAVGVGQHVIGGLASLESTEPLDDVLALVFEWTERAPMPTARGGAACALIDELIYCAGGEAGSSALRATEVYDPSADVWTELDPMPRGRAGTGGAALGGALWVPGGAHRLAFEPADTVERFTP